MINDLGKILEFESIMAEPSGKNAPFGENLKNTLEWFLKKGESYGLTTKNIDGYCGYVEYGSGEKCIGILAHLDVVPANASLWTFNPFALNQDDTYFYGRGVVDNKGPAIVALHILKNLKENNIKLNKRVRLIVGCNEENGSACMKHYKKINQELPEYNIVPDADFPIINSEKGILRLNVSFEIDDIIRNNIEVIKAGTRPNVIPDSCVLIAKKDSELTKELQKTSNIINVKINDKTITSSGIAGHAMNPKSGDNAIFNMFKLLSTLKSLKDSKIMHTINDIFCNLDSPKNLKVNASDEQSGELTINLGLIELKENLLTLTLDIRMPISITKNEVIDNIKNMCKNAKIEILDYTPNLFIDKDSKLVTTLLDVYKSSTGLETYCVKTGGGTYARELPNSVAFGPTFVNAITNIHNIDEKISKQEFFKLYNIYYNAVLKLCEL